MSAAQPTKPDLILVIAPPAFCGGLIIAWRLGWLGGMIACLAIGTMELEEYFKPTDVFAIFCQLNTGKSLLSKIAESSLLEWNLNISAVTEKNVKGSPIYHAEINNTRLL